MKAPCGTEKAVNHEKTVFELQQCKKNPIHKRKTTQKQLDLSESPQSQYIFLYCYKLNKYVKNTRHIQDPNI